MGDVENKKGTYNDDRDYTVLDIAREKHRAEVVSVLERFTDNPTLTGRKSGRNSTSQVFFLFPFSFLNKIETSLERFLGVQGGLSVCASTTPGTFTDSAEVTYLSLTDCGLTTVPDKIGLNFFFSFYFFSFDSDSLELQPPLSMWLNLT